MIISKSYRLILSGLFLILLCNSLYANFKAVQVSYLKCPNLADFEKELIKIKKAGFNAVIFRVFNNKGDRIYPFIPKMLIKNNVGVYFKTSFAPVVYNLLPEIINLCHKHNLNIIAWITSRYLDFYVNNNTRKVKKFNLKTGQFEVSKGLTFFSKENVEYIGKIYQDLVKYDIDGILFQDDVKILVDEDFNINAIRKFYKKTGIKLNKKNIKKILYANALARDKISFNKNLKIWNSIKSEQINNFLGIIINKCKSINKNLKFFMNVNYETLYRPELSKLWYSYDLNSLKSTYVDYFVVMLYQIQMMKELNFSQLETYKFIYKIVKNCSKNFNINRMVFKIQTYDWYKNKILKKNNINKLFTFFCNNNIKNIAIFPYYKKLTMFNLGCCK